MTAKKATQTAKKAENVKISAPSATVETTKTETAQKAETVKKEVKEEVKEEVKAVAKQDEVKAEAPKKDTAKAVKAEAPKKEKKAEPKKRAAKPKTEKKEAVQNVYVQFLGKEILTSDLVAQVTESWVAQGHRASSIKELNLYVKPEDSAAYYVINGKESGKIEL